MKKKIFLFVLILLLLASTACKKSSNDESTTVNHTISYVTNCECCKIKNSHGVITETPHVSNPGYKLDGWYLNSDFTGKKITFPFTPEQDGTLYAKWDLTNPNEAIKFIFEQTYENKYMLPTNESIEKTDNKYTYKRELEKKFTYQFSLSFSCDSSTIQSILTKKGTTYLQGTLLSLSSVNITFSFGNFTKGVSLLNEISIYHKGYLANRNLFSAKITDIVNHEPVVTFTPNKGNRNKFYIYTMTPATEIVMEDEESDLKNLFNDMVYLCNEFLGNQLQVC